MTEEKSELLVNELWDAYYSVLNYKDLVSIRNSMIQYSNDFKYFTALDSIEYFADFLNKLDCDVQSRLSYLIFNLRDELISQQDFELLLPHVELLNRYKEILNKQPNYDNHTETKLSSPYLTKKHLLWMIEEASISTDKDKANRWLGYIQGVLAERGIIDLKAEINLSREVFKGKS